MNDLQRRGVGGVRIVLFGNTLDSPGRREILHMQAVTAFYPCPHCLYTAQPGVRKQTFGGYRRFLPMNSPWRQREFVFNGQRYMFRDVEQRPPPTLRTDQNVATMVSLARRTRPFCGHKGLPFLSAWIGADWAGHVCDAMHDGKNFIERFLCCVVGPGAQGMYKEWAQKNRDSQHREDCRKYGIFHEVHDGATRLPWRLTKLELKVLDKLVRSIWWPHYVERVCDKTHSFWNKPKLMWKAKHKSYILMVLLPTLLEGYITAVHTALLHIVNALRHLDGQVYSVSEARVRDVEPGSRVIEKGVIPYWRQVLILGLVLLEGSFPVATLNPAMHHFCHYGGQTKQLGILGWLAMWSFERNNKFIKGMVRNRRYTLASLAKNVEMNIATRFVAFAKKGAELLSPPTLCQLSKRSVSHGIYLLSRREKIDLALLGVTAFDDVCAFEIARVMGVHFRAGEWGRPRCGSVITTIFDRRSRYCYVKKFLKVQGQFFARVEWLSVPTYPYAPDNRLVVRVRKLADAQQRQHRCFVPLEDIDPCTVAVIPQRDGVHFSMLRDKGYDRVDIDYIYRIYS